MTDKVTSIKDIIEDTLHEPLAKTSINYYSSLSDNDIIKLKEGLNEYTSSEYIRAPALPPDERVWSFHPDSPITNALGGAGNGFGQRPPNSMVEMRANLVLMFLYFPRVSIRDGLEYYTDGFPSYAPERRTIVQQILSFYCEIGDLLDKQVFLIPRRFWFDVANTGLVEKQEAQFGPGYHSRLRFFATSEFGRQLAREDWLTDNPKKYVTTSLLNEPMLQGLSVAELASAYLRHGDSYRRCVDLMQYCGTYACSPALQTKEDQVFWQAIVNGAVTGDDNQAQDAKAIPPYRVLLPHLGQLKVHDVVNLVSSGGLQNFRSTIANIEFGSESRADRPLELKEFIREQLEDAKSKLETEIKKSSFLSYATEGLRAIGLGAVTNTALEAADPSLMDPWLKVLINSGVPVVWGVKEVIADIKQTKQRKRLAALYAEMIEAN